MVGNYLSFTFVVQKQNTMKLLLCKNCQDIFKVTLNLKTCECGLTSGVYKDNLNAVYSGEFATPLGFHNSSFRNAVINQPTVGQGKDFIAFVIQQQCPTFIKSNTDLS